VALDFSIATLEAKYALNQPTATAAAPTGAAEVWGRSSEPPKVPPGRVWRRPVRTWRCNVQSKANGKTKEKSKRPAEVQLTPLHVDATGASYFISWDNAEGKPLPAGQRAPLEALVRQSVAPLPLLAGVTGSCQELVPAGGCYSAAVLLGPVLLAGLRMRLGWLQTWRPPAKGAYMLPLERCLSTGGEIGRGFPKHSLS
jgi:hypothetical protein